MRRIFILLICIAIYSCKQESKTKEVFKLKNTVIGGYVFGTRYQVTYSSNISYEKQFDSLFYAINKSMSTYQANSDISKLNRGEFIEIDNHFKTVFDTSKIIYNETNGAFDPTIGIVVNAWSFGPDDKIEHLNKYKIDSLMQFVGFDKVELNQNELVKPKGTFLDFNAIAKGYGVDVIARFLNSKNIENYLINIGGEIRAKGRNIDLNKSWRIGIQDPRIVAEESIGKPILLVDESMATSGIYRKFKVDENGNRYSHIIDTKTGYPSKTNLLSISVIAENCMVADAYATAFKAMGIEKVKIFLEKHPELKVFLIFENEEKELETLSLNGFSKD